MTGRDELRGRFRDVSGQVPPPEPEYWEPLIFRAEQIEAEIDRLAGLDRPANGRRESWFVHPRAPESAVGLAPGIRVALSVLLPGERTRPIRHNSTQVEFCILGAGQAVIEGRKVDFDRYDAWNVPAHRTYWHENTGAGLQVRLTYSNAPVLERLQVHLVEDNPSETSPVPDPSAGNGDTRRQSPFGTVTLDDRGAALMPYERLISPPSVESLALHWPWRAVKAHLDELVDLGTDYVGRRLYLLYNPVTGRTNGTTPSFFATLTIRPPGIVDRPHRHVSAAINYFFQGHGWSTVSGGHYEWGPGDLMLTAPGWAVHHHASHDAEPVYELTVQDQPYHLALESLLWQEDLSEPARLLGVESGFATNRSREEAS